MTKKIKSPASDLNSIKIEGSRTLPAKESTAEDTGCSLSREQIKACLAKRGGLQNQKEIDEIQKELWENERIQDEKELDEFEKIQPTTVEKPIAEVAWYDRLTPEEVEECRVEYEAGLNQQAIERVQNEIYGIEKIQPSTLDEYDNIKQRLDELRSELIRLGSYQTKDDREKADEQNQDAAKQQTLCVEDFIQQQRTNGKQDEIIALELHDKKGIFKLTYADIGKIF